MNCVDCRFYEGKGDKQGICVRYPPSVFPFPTGSKVVGGAVGLQLQSFLPPVSAGGWCGEWGLKTLNG